MLISPAISLFSNGTWGQECLLSSLSLALSRSLSRSLSIYLSLSQSRRHRHFYNVYCFNYLLYLLIHYNYLLSLTLQWYLRS